MKNIEYVNVFLEEFSKNVKTNHKSKNTFTLYKQCLSKLQDWENNKELLEQMNFLLTNDYSDNTNYTTRAVFKVFINWYSNITKTYIPFESNVKKFKWISGTRNAYDNSNLRLLLNELKEYKDKRFQTIFLIFLANGFRVSEWDAINFKYLKANGWKMLIDTAKRGNKRIIYIPDNDIFSNLRKDIENTDLSLKSKTIKNMFYEFSKFVKTKHPEFTQMISVHILRHCFATKAAKNLGSIESVAKILGHVNSKVTESTYINYEAEYSKNLIQIANLNTLDALDLKEMRENLRFERQKNIALTEEIESLKKEIASLKSQNLHHPTQYKFKISNFNELIK